ncbi:MAG TPA: GNAT family N-acetyltransferase [Bacteroidia bacterium]|nr:GNAT family N-acetyltransferase [Bacteroidia bacterium]
MNSKTESPPSALTFCRIEAGEREEELLQSIREILHEGASHNAEFFDAALWNWQYKNLPTHQSAVYVCLDDGKISGYYHVPFYEGIIRGEKKKFGVVQDVAVSKRLRGGGVFNQLASFATEDLLKSGIDFLYTFPNDKSIHTFLKYNGYSTVHTFDTFILPVKTSLLIQSKVKLFGLEKIIGAAADLFFKRSFALKKDEQISVNKNFDDATVGLFEKFSSRFPVHRARTKNYLQWRYVEKPTVNHVIVSLKAGTQTIAAAVFRTDVILNVNSLLLMDFAFEEEAQLAKLIHYVRMHSKEIFAEQAAMIFTAFCCNDFLKTKRYGFIRIPKKFNPRNLNLLARTAEVKTEDTEELFKKENWFATPGDWDVF